MARRAEPAQGSSDRNGHVPPSLDGANNPNHQPSNGDQAEARAQLGDLRDRVHEALGAGERVTGQTIAQWLGVSPRTGRRRLALLIEEDPVLSDALSRE
jgi:hypothetical protein